MDRLLVAAVALAVLSPCPAGAKDKAFGPPAGAKWVPIPELTDEFEGERLDPSKWHDHNPRWKGRQPAFFAKHNVKVDGGKLHLTMRKENLPHLPKGYHTFTSAAVQSKGTVRYGYFEVKCRPMDSRGSSAFWFYQNTPEIWTEIDVFEIGGKAPKHERVLHMNVHVFHTPVNPDRHWARPKRHETAFRLADDFHVYALEWDPQRVRFHLDGRCVAEQANTHWHQPLTLNFDSETMPNWFGLPDPNDLPSTFSIEYVRAWKKAGGYGPERCRSYEVTFDAKEAAAAKGETRTYTLAADAPGRLVVVARHGGQPRPHRVHLAYEDAAFFAKQTAAKITKAVAVKDRSGRELTLRFA